MRAIIQRNIGEVSQLCESTGLPLPDLSVILAGSESEGTVAEALHKLNVMLAQLKAIVAEREPIIKQIREVEEAFREAHWHFQHQQDNLFNNRARTCSNPLFACRTCCPLFLTQSYHCLVAGMAGLVGCTLACQKQRCQAYLMCSQDSIVCRAGMQTACCSA